MRSLRGGFSGGTVDSARQQAIAARADDGVRRTLGDPYSLSPRPDEEPPTGCRRANGIAGALRRLVPIDRDPEMGRWTGPFVMASFNTRIVRLSNTLTEWSYGRDLRYREVTDFGSGPMSPVRAGCMAIGILCLALDDRMPQRAGVCTPATAMGEVLVDRLRRQGFMFEVERVAAE